MRGIKHNPNFSFITASGSQYFVDTINKTISGGKLGNNIEKYISLNKENPPYYVTFNFEKGGGISPTNPIAQNIIRNTINNMDMDLRILTDGFPGHNPDVVIQTNDNYVYSIDTHNKTIAGDTFKGIYRYENTYSINKNERTFVLPNMTNMHVCNIKSEKTLTSSKTYDNSIRHNPNLYLHTQNNQEFFIDTVNKTISSNTLKPQQYINDPIFIQGCKAEFKLNTGVTLKTDYITQTRGYSQNMYKENNDMDLCI